MYVYLENRDEPHGSGARFTVGFYKPSGQWEPESDHGSAGEAAARVAYLNGGTALDGPASGERERFQHPPRWTMKILVLVMTMTAALLSPAVQAHTAVDETWTLFSVLESTEEDRPGWAYELLANEGVDTDAAKAAVKLAQESFKRHIALAAELVATICRDGQVLAANRDALADRMAEMSATFQAYKVEQAEALRALLTPRDYDRAIGYVKFKVTSHRQTMDIDPPQMMREGKLDPAEVVRLSCPAKEGEPKAGITIQPEGEPR